MLTSEVLRRARDLIDTPEKWCQGDLGGNGSYCAVGACKLALGMDLRDPIHFNGIPDVLRELEAVMRMWPSEFNDAAHTTHADVMAAFDQAIAEAEAQEQPTPNADELQRILAACDALTDTLTDSIIAESPDYDRATVRDVAHAEVFMCAQDVKRLFGPVSAEEREAVKRAIRDSLGLSS